MKDMKKYVLKSDNINDDGFNVCVADKSVGLKWN